MTETECAAGPWISVEKRLPKPGEEVLLLAYDRREPIYDIGYQEMSGSGRWMIYGGTVAGITHWMPLPELPEEDGNDD